MDHMKLSDELRQQLMESAAWGKAGITPRLNEAASEAAHVCPLCVSELSEAIDEERILEHLNVVVGLVDRLSQLNEGDEDVETVIDATIQELLFQDLDEE